MGHGRYGSSYRPRSGFGGLFAAAWQRSQGSLSLLMVGVCVAVFLATELLHRSGAVSLDTLYSYLALSHEGVLRHGRVYQFITAPLLHGDVGHLLFNMLALWMLGPGVERVLGRGRYVRFSILCALCSMLGQFLVSWGGEYYALGYSGVIFGILVGQAIYFPDHIIILMFFPMRMRHAAILLAAVELYLTVSQPGSGIAHAAHLFGGVAAFVYLRWLRRARRNVTDRRIPLEF